MATSDHLDRLQTHDRRLPSSTGTTNILTRYSGSGSNRSRAKALLPPRRRHQTSLAAKTGLRTQPSKNPPRMHGRSYRGLLLRLSRHRCHRRLHNQRHLPSRHRRLWLHLPDRLGLWYRHCFRHHHLRFHLWRAFQPGCDDLFLAMAGVPVEESTALHLLPDIRGFHRGLVDGGDVLAGNPSVQGREPGRREGFGL